MSLFDLQAHDLVRVLAALVIGSLIGLEREYRSKAAGFRTMTLICVGAAVFTMLSLRLGAGGSPDRIASNVIMGIGFIGAGVIFKERHQHLGADHRCGDRRRARVSRARPL